MSSEREDALAARISRRLELALHLKVFRPEQRHSPGSPLTRLRTERITAENYQLMNYGFGGLISLHLDAR